MNHLQKLKTPSLKWVFPKFPKTHFSSSKTSNLLCFISIYGVKNPIFYSSRAENTEKDQIFDGTTMSNCHRGRRTRSQIEAQDALLEYLHMTRGLPFTDAEHMSKNSPIFLAKLLKNVDEQEIGRSMTKFFHYHPINEFEPFFESMGLTSDEMNLILPRNLMFLKDDDMLLENYQVLCNYGITRSMIGKFYKESMEIFRYDHGVLFSKIQAYEHLGLTRASVIKVATASPSLLLGNVDGDFIKLLDVLKTMKIQFEWIERRLSERNSYDWSRMLRFLNFICEMGYTKEELGALIKRHLELLLDGSGRKAFSLVGFLWKLGFTMKEISSLLMQLPQVKVGTFLKNLRQCLFFFMFIEMDGEDIVEIVRMHPLLLGSIFLKKPNSVLSILNIGKKRLCNIIKEDPYQLKNWILGLKVEPLPNSGEDERSLKQKTEFLLNLGFTKNSAELKKALKVFRGKGGELQERFDCFLKAGLEWKDVSEMIKVAPQVLNQSKDVIEGKIDFLLNELGYPISALVAFPAYINYTIERVKLRFSMYTWLRDEGVAAPMLALSTIIACSEKIFMRQFVKYHPRGPEVWENMKKAHCL